ncbi:hypothetical protein CNBG_3869 [Cryptococcus deuterogattii R265]|uniref:DUF1688-domain-containing protein n=1 Tax=Cryptococcus deuterogattii (strain R265) TaxID=294750 RepID=A0A095CDD2_CRYD2|nr:hypothetical protein CNBG_3869 [Cryptococcus deuterogattii R265]KIR28061.1 hypothetical protein I309_03058 [Cryptococcus deuterogattii LA55]KIR70687.1 hypothetical protein I310_05538 [Cryptococcus deuterogattii CA1014]KIR90734.1 hypothetical protein I304_05383 [Cryptococcus deuterogattii CBS 10090]KIR97526.1 hypothetical protein L804_05213 [Cryptococcus deuterogattii 2001/935-1]
MPTPQVVTYLRSLEAVRDRSKQVYKLGVDGKLDHWTFDEAKLADIADYCSKIITRDFGTDYASIPPHCRRGHFITPSHNRIATLLAKTSFPSKSDPLARAGALIDLYLVSVLLDAGAGPDWTYTETDEEGKETWKGGRSEGLAVASYHMFINGLFSSSDNKFQVDATALKKLTPELLAKHLQVSQSNPMAGLEGRCNLLIKLGDALAARPDLCATGRPGDLLIYFEPKVKDSLRLSDFWSTLFDLVLPIWPSRVTLPSHPTYPLGDVWPCKSLSKSLDQAGKERKEGDDFVPFHKLTQWLCYSLVDAIESETGWKVDKGLGQTGLPEYRNGGLFIDLGAFIIKPESLGGNAYPNGKDKPPVLEPSHPAVIEWRALTVISLDRIHNLLCEKLQVSQDVLALAQVLEAATWKGGREIAKEKRTGGGPPIDIISDGTVF